MSTSDTPSGLRKLAYASTVISGGIVGTDYANGLDIHPLIGLVLGAIASAFLTALLFHISEDPGGEIKAGLGYLGGVLGAGFGLYVGFASEANVLIALIIFTGIGFGLGQLVAGLLSFAAMIMLFISRGPIGAFLREAFISAYDSMQQSQGELLASADNILDSAAPILPHALNFLS